MSDMMTFPETWEEFEKSYGFTDSEEVYTNGSRLIPSFRVKQWLDHEETKRQAIASSNCISRQDAINKFERWLKVEGYNRGELNVLKAVLYELRFMPPASPDLSNFSDKLWKIAYERGKAEGRKKGKWKEHDYDEDKYDVIKCPCCMHMFTVDSFHWTDIGFVKDDFKFCPNCGADMREGEEE